MASSRANRLLPLLTSSAPLHLPTRPTGLFSPPCRAFSTTPAASRKGGASHSARMKKVMGGGSQGSPLAAKREAMKKALATGEAFDAMGVAPETFVTLPRTERPGWISETSSRWMWERARAQSRFRTALVLLYFKFWKLRTRSPAEARGLGRWARLKYRLFGWWDLDMFKVPRIAQGLYEDMYRALAEGAVDAKLEGKVKPELMLRLKSRVAARAKGEEMEWKVDWSKGGKKCVSYSILATGLDDKGGWEQTFLQQAVVQLDSLQSIRRWKVDWDAKKAVIKKGNGQEKALEGGEQTAAVFSEPKAVREYVVLHKSVVDGQQGPWRLWGMTQPTTFHDVKRARLERLGKPA